MPKTKPFDRYSRRYDAWFDRNRYTYLSELEAIRSVFEAGGRWVEIGVGSGRFAAPLGIEAGIEPSRAMGRIARKRGVEVIDAVAEVLPIADGKLDGVLMVTTICFLDDIARSMKEAYRVLSPSGHLVIGFINRGSPLGSKYERRKRGSAFYSEANFYSVGEVVSHIRTAGFRNFDFRQTIFRDPRQISGIEQVKNGYGDGLFVVVRGTK